MGDDPGKLGGGKVGIERQARARQRFRLGAILLQALYDPGGAAVLPYDDRRDRFLRLRVPGKAAFTLVVDAERAGLADGLGTGIEIVDQLFGVVLDPARLRIDLAMLHRLRPPGASVRLQHQGAGAGGALVDGGAATVTNSRQGKG